MLRKTGDFNIFLNTTLESEGGSPDIRRLRNPDAKQFTLRKKHTSGFVQRRLDFFDSNRLQDVITHVDFFAALSTDHSPVTISVSKNKNRLVTVSLLSEHYFRKTENVIKPFTVAKVFFRISN